MRIFLAGATGAVGRSLVPLLLSRGHRVFATTRTPAKAAALRSAGADPVVVDGLDREGLLRAVRSARPDVVVHQMTALSGMTSLRNIDETMALTNRLRTEGTEYLLAAARAAGAQRFVAQSFTGWPNAREGEPGEDRGRPAGRPPGSPPWRARWSRSAASSRWCSAPPDWRASCSATAPSTVPAPGWGSVASSSRPSAGDGSRSSAEGRASGRSSTSSTWPRPPASRSSAGRPASTTSWTTNRPRCRLWLPELARAVGAKPPYHVPAWVGRLVIGEAGVRMMTEQRGSSNAKAEAAARLAADLGELARGVRLRTLVGEGRMSATPPVVADSVSNVLTKRERILYRTATGFANDNRPLLADWNRGPRASLDIG